MDKRQRSPSPFAAFGVFSLSRWEREGARDAQRRGEGEGERSNGFTLIEMMVALAVFSLAAMALIRLESATIRGASILDSTLTAQLVARNVAIEAVTDAQPPALGNADGTERNGGRDWRWTRKVTPTGDARILRIDVTVADQGGTVQGRLTMVRPATRPAATVTSS